MIFRLRRTNSPSAGFVLALGLIFPLTLSAETSSAPLNYASAVCWKYEHLPHLRAWQETEKIILTALAEGVPQLHSLAREQNDSAEQLQEFFRKLPDSDDSLTIIYLAAHQSPAGQWYFPDGTEHSWGSLIEGLAKLKSIHRLVLLDCCYAQSAALWPGWPDKIAPACLFAAPANRPTPDLLVFHRRPVDWATYFPKAVPWLKQHHFSNSDERISFFGLVWLEAWLDQPATPQNLAGWKDLSQTMEQIVQRTSPNVRADAISEISSMFPR